MVINNEKLLEVSGGAITGTFINSISRAINSVLDVGRSLGTAIRMIYSNRKC